ncbi:MAG: hypothetical protein ACP5D8_09490 [Fidelibacterota bacterium]
MKKLDSQQQNALIAIRGLSMMRVLRLNNNAENRLMNDAGKVV